MPGADPSSSSASQRRATVQASLDRSGQYPRWVLLTTLTGMFATTFPITLLAVSLSTIAEDFGTTETTMSWVVSAPTLTAAIALPILGKLGDLYGHRLVFLTGFVASTAVTAVTVFAWDPISLIALRSLAVTIGAATMPSSMALINSVHAPSQRAKAMGWWSLVAAGSPAIGLVLGGPIIDLVGWRPVFGVQAVLSIVPVVVAFLVLRETERRLDVGFDVPGAATLALGTGGLMVAINQFGEAGLQPHVIGAAVIAAIGLPLFVWIESRVDAPLLPLDFFRRRNFAATLVASFFAGAAYMGGFILAPLLLQSVFAFSVTATSMLMLVRPVFFSGTSPIGGSLATRFGERPIALIGTASIAIALVLLGFGTETELLILIVVGLALQGIGNGGAQPTLNAVLSNSVAEQDLGTAAAAQRMAFQVGVAFGITVMTSVYGGTEQPRDFLIAYLVGAGLGALSFFFTLFTRSTPKDADELAAATPDERVASTPALAAR